MLNLKYDIKINLKNEKEVFSFARLFIFTILFSAIFLELPDYIWNMTWYKISSILVMWVIAIPAIVNCFERKVKLREIFGTKVMLQIVKGVALGTAMAAVAVVITQQPGVAIIRSSKISDIAFRFVFYVFAIGATEELIYRVAFIGALNKIIKNKWIVYMIADILFACAHLFQSSWANAIFNLFAGWLYIAMYKWKKGGYVFAFVTHGIYDFMLAYLPLFCFWSTLK